MTLSNEMDIFIVTYNRAINLKNTLEQLLNEESPVKDFYITIIDNNSPDDTETVCKSYCEHYPKLRYIKNNKNIGCVLNIIKAMELADKKWYWILGDDDNYDWSAWSEIENALNQDYDAVYTCWHEGTDKNDKKYLLNESGFIATAIVNTKHLTSDVLANAAYYSTTFDPHSVPIAKIINENGKIYMPSKKLCLENVKKDYSHTTKKDDFLHSDIRNFNVFYDAIRKNQMITDKKLRYKMNEVLFLGKSFKYSIALMFKIGLETRKVIELLFYLNFKQKVVLISFWILSILKKIFKLLIFNQTKTDTHREYKILGIKIKKRLA